MRSKNRDLQHSPKRETHRARTSTQILGRAVKGEREPSTVAAWQGSAGEILQLQRAVGNRVVAGLLDNIQPRLAMGPANDPYEQEADRVAEQVVSNPGQREANPAKAHTPQPGSHSPAPDPRGGLREKRAIQPGTLAATVSRLLRQRARPKDEENSTSEILTGRQNDSKPLPDSLRAYMEPRFGADFSGVRLHTGGEAAVLNRSVGARAFTYGQDIYLGEGQAELDSNEGKRLLAHELTHTIQQGAVSPRALLEVPAASTQAVVQRKVIIGEAKGESAEYDVKDLVKKLDEVNEQQVGHKVYSALKPDQKKARLKDFVKDRKNSYKFEYVEETRIDPKSGNEEKYWWKVTTPEKTGYFLYSYEGWRSFLDIFIGAEPVEKKAASDAIGMTVIYKDTPFELRTPLIEQLVEDYGLNEDTVKTSLSRMISGGQANRDLKRSGPALKTDPELDNLRAARHESFGIGENGCTFFFLKSSEAVTIIAVGNHIRDAKHYQIVYGASGYPARGKFEF